MKAIVLDRPGGPNMLRVADISMPQPRPGEVRIAVRAAGLNPADYKHIQVGMPDWQYPMVTGCDLAGEVDAIGPGVDMPLGLRVLVKTPLARLGAFAEYCTIPAFLAMSLPDNVSFIEAAALPTAGITAFQAVIRRLRVQAGDNVLVQGGAGGVGGFAVQLAARAGAIVAATGSKSNLHHLASLGAVHSIDYANEDLALRSANIAPGGYDAIVDAVGPTTAAASLALLSSTGAGLACIAGLPKPDALAHMLRNTSLHDIAVDFPFRTSKLRAQEDVPAMGRELLAMLSRGELNAMVTEIVPMADIPATLQRLALNRVRGKTVASFDV